MTIKHTGILAVVAVLGGAALLTRSLAQTAVPIPATRAAVCDVVDVFNNYQRAKDLTAQLNERREAIKAEAEKRNKVIDARQLELESYKKGSQKYKETQNEITRLNIEAKAYLQYQDALALREHRELTKDMYDEIMRMIAQVARQKGITLVLQRDVELQATDNTAELLRQIRDRKVLYVNDALDITAEVLAALNNSYKAGKAGR